jgi:hypothetical protein
MLEVTGMDSSADFFGGGGFASLFVSAGSDVDQGSLPMTFVGKLSVLTAYVAFAFVGAIVLGMI